MTLSLFHIRKHLAGPLAWLMGLVMLSPLSPHLAEGVALCIGEGHVGVETTGASHHDDSAPPLVSGETGASGEADRETVVVEPGSAFSSEHSSSSTDDECADIPLRLVRAGNACYQAIQNGGGPDVPPVALAAGFARTSDTTPSVPVADTRGSRRPRAPAPPSSPLPSSTVVLLI